MRSDWQQKPTQPISTNQIAQMCVQVFGDDKFTDLQVLTHGRSHQNHCLTLPNGLKVVLRVGDNENNLKKQHALAQKLWRKLPVPRFLSGVLQANGGKFFAFLEFKIGDRLADIQSLTPADQAHLGFELGEYLAQIHSQTFKQAGEFDQAFKIAETYDMGADGLSQIFKNLINTASRHGRILVAEAKKYSTVFAKKIQVIDQWQHPNCLLHADLNEDNILHNDGHISAILDWEFTMSGHPALDFGKFTRTPYINCPIFLENLCDSYYLTHKSLPANWDDIAAITDLMSWAEFLSRQNLQDDVKLTALKKLEILL